jgi:hypothetical protein
VDNFSARNTVANPWLYRAVISAYGQSVNLFANRRAIMSESEGIARKVINVKGVEAAIWDEATTAADNRKESYGVYLSRALRTQLAVDRGAVKLPDEPVKPPMTTDQLTARITAQAALFTAMAAAKQAKVRVPRLSDLGLARMGTARALAAEQPALIEAAEVSGGKTSAKSGKESAGLGTIRNEKPSGGIDRYDVAHILQGTEQ